MLALASIGVFAEHVAAQPVDQNGMWTMIPAQGLPFGSVWQLNVMTGESYLCAMAGDKGPVCIKTVYVEKPASGATPPAPSEGTDLLKKFGVTPPKPK